MKTQEELKQIKEEVETFNENLHELTDDELEQVAGGKRRYERTHTEIEISCPQCGYLLERIEDQGWLATTYYCPDCKNYMNPRFKQIEVSDR